MAVSRVKGGARTFGAFVGMFRPPSRLVRYILSLRQIQHCGEQGCDHGHDGEQRAEAETANQFAPRRERGNEHGDDEKWMRDCRRPIGCRRVDDGDAEREFMLAKDLSLLACPCVYSAGKY